MAKKAQAETVEVAPQNTNIPKVKKDTWEIKNRLYEIASGKEPLVFSIVTSHSNRKPMLWFDEEQGYQRELRYATNQRSPFVDEQKGQVTMGRIIFRDGKLNVPKENIVLQKLLSLYHPELIAREGCLFTGHQLDRKGIYFSCWRKRTTLFFLHIQDLYLLLILQKKEMVSYAKITYQSTQMSSNK